MKILGFNFCWHDWVKVDFYSNGWDVYTDEVCVKCEAVSLNATKARRLTLIKANKRVEKANLAHELYKRHKESL
jgi:hypothetical protein